MAAAPPPLEEVLALDDSESRSVAFASSDRGTAAIELLRLYVRQHGRAALAAEGLASRRFVVGRYACPEQLGNRMMDFLNAFIGAVVANRTLLWRYCHKDPATCPFSGPVKGCDAVYQRREWMASADEVLRSLGGADARHPAYPSRREPVRHRYQTRAYLALHPSNDQLACCGIDRLAARVVDFGVLDSSPRAMAAALGAPGATLGEAARRRAAQLFADGEGVAYGAAFRAAFRAAPALARLRVRRDVAAPRAPAAVSTFGVHLRHQHPQDSGAALGPPAACLRRQLGAARGAARGASGGCVVLLASDRASTFDRAPSAFGAHGCSVVSVARGRESLRRSHGYAEHGPWAGAAAALDMELLARASAGFVGTNVSSLSFLMYARAALRAAEASRPPVVMHALPGCRQLPPMPPPPPWPCEAACGG